MARRTNSDEPAVNLDSLMDALTNVVAVLILVLILLQADVGQKVQRLLDDMPPATPEQIEKSKQDLAALTRERDHNKALLNAKAPEPQLVEQTKAQLALLEKSIKDSDVRLLDLEKLRQLQVRHQSERDAEQKKTDALIAEIRKFEALLDNTPLPQAKKPDVVRIPNSREIPAGANVYFAHVIGDRVHLVDPVTARKMIMDEFEKVRSKMLRDTIKVKGARDRKVYDQEKLVKHFDSLKLQVRGQKISLLPNRPWTRLPMRIEIDTKNGGVPLAAMNAQNSEWHRICNLVRSFPKSVLIFRVHPNGFPTYLKAREIADRFNIPCGWEINGSPNHVETINDFEVNRLEQPKPQAPKPPAPPAPKKGLD